MADPNSVEERFANCMNWLINDEKIELITYGIQCVVFVPLMIYTMVRFREDLHLNNKILLLNWAVSGFLFFVSYVFRYASTIEVPWYIWLITFVYEDICYIFFLTILFKLDNMIIHICNK